MSKSFLNNFDDIFSKTEYATEIAHRNGEDAYFGNNNNPEAQEAKLENNNCHCLAMDHMQMQPNNASMLAHMEQSLFPPFFPPPRSAKSEESSLSEDKEEKILCRAKGEAQPEKSEGISPFLFKKRSSDGLGRKLKSSGEVGLHTKFAEDNILIRIKRKVIDCFLKFTLRTIKKEIKLNEKEPQKNLLEPLNKKFMAETKIRHVRSLLRMRFREIFSEDVSLRKKKLRLDHNRRILKAIMGSSKMLVTKCVLDVTFEEGLKIWRKKSEFVKYFKAKKCCYDKFSVDDLCGCFCFLDDVLDCELKNEPLEYKEKYKKFALTFESVYSSKQEKKDYKPRNKGFDN